MKCDHIFWIEVILELIAFNQNAFNIFIDYINSYHIVHKNNPAVISIMYIAVLMVLDAIYNTILASFQCVLVQQKKLVQRD